MNARQILFLFGIFGLIFAPETFCEAENEKIFEPTRFQSVLLPELTPENQALLEETGKELKNDAEISRASFEILRGFLVLRSENYLRENGDFILPHSTPAENSSLKETDALIWDSKDPMTSTPRQKVSERIRAFLETLPPETLLAWRLWVDENVEAMLNSARESKVLPTPEKLKRLIRENPFSSYEAEFWELLAQNAWQNRNVASAASYWEMELHAREILAESLPKTFILKELPALETVQNLIKASQNSAQTENAEQAPSSEEAANLKTEKTWHVFMTRIDSSSGQTVFEDLLPESQRGMLFPDRNRDLDVENEETPQFLTFSPGKKFLIARLGTRVSLWPEEEREVRPQPFLVVLDLSRGGQLVWMKTPVSLNSVFIGNPLANAEFVFIPTLRLGKNAQISVDVYSLSDGTLQKIIPLFEVSLAEIQSPANETIFLPIEWTPEGKIRVGGIRSGVQMVVD